MRYVVEYIAEAVKLERLAAAEPKPDVKAQLQKQAAAYRKLADERAKKLGIAPPENIE